ncbi:MAG: hypothetical protein U1E45_05695 [Geminicoccaceae bacterium]
MIAETSTRPIEQAPPAALATDPHVAWLAERDALVARWGADRDISDDENDARAAELAALEDRIIHTPAQSADGAMAQLRLYVTYALDVGVPLLTCGPNRAPVMAALAAVERHVGARSA